MAQSATLTRKPAEADTADAAAAPVKPPKTTGERWFDGIRFALGEGVILGVTAGIAYLAKHGKDKYAGIPNGLKWLNEKIMPDMTRHPSSKKDAMIMRLSAAAGSTTLLMHGGNAFIPVMKKLQDSKEKIVNYFNDHRGRPGEVEAGKARVKSETKETWGDIIKGRIAGWLLVFSALVATDAVVGSDSKGQYRLDKLEEKIGRLSAGITKKGRDIARTPLSQQLTDAQKASKTYRFGKILALDVFATTAVMILWPILDRISATMRSKEARVENEEKAVADAAAENRIPLEASAEPQHAIVGQYTSAVREEGHRDNSISALTQGQLQNSAITRLQQQAANRNTGELSVA